MSKKDSLMISLALSLSQAEVAARLGITRRKVEIIEKKALKKMLAIVRSEKLAFADFTDSLARDGGFSMSREP